MIKVYTRGYGGNTLSKNIVVESNDPARPKTTLRVRGEVERFVDLSPDRVFLNGPVDGEVSAQVRVTPRARFPFQVLAVRLQQGRDAVASVEGISGGPTGTEYRISVVNTRKSAGRYFDILLIETDHPQQPLIRVNVFGHLTAPGEPAAGASKAPAGKAVSN